MAPYPQFTTTRQAVPSGGEDAAAPPVRLQSVCTALEDTVFGEVGHGVPSVGDGQQEPFDVR